MRTLGLSIEVGEGGERGRFEIPADERSVVNDRERMSTSIVACIRLGQRKSESPRDDVVGGNEEFEVAAPRAVIYRLTRNDWLSRSTTLRVGHKDIGAKALITRSNVRDL